MCDNDKKCANFLGIKEETGCNGGQWFHFKCTGLKRLPGSKQKWICKLCEFQGIEPLGNRKKI